MESLSWKNLRFRLHALLKALLPPFQEIYVLDLQLSKDQQNPIFHQFYGILIKGVELIKKCENVNPYNLFLVCRHAFQILKLENEINDYMRIMPAHILLDARKVMIELRNVCRPAAEDVCGMLAESLAKQASMLTNDSSHNSIVLKQMFAEDLQDEMMEDSSYSSVSNIGNSQFYVGMENSIRNVKELLFKNHVSVVGVKCMGGGGKTTLALSICNDPQIKGYFGNNVLFLTVSQSPNLKGILETMWDKIVGRGRPEFQNAEDAHIQLQNQLLMQSKPILVILDDVWSRVHLETLLFEGTAYKTVVTTRNSSIIPQNPSTVLYQLPLLSHHDALSLFCFWAFGHTSIPNSADANLVKEVQAKCKGLPLALKVIGSSLRGESRMTWESAKYKLSKGEAISDYHKEGLFRCLETSIDFLDETTRECFLDLAAFPEDRKICVGALLDVWVNVRNLEWNDAFLILLELASRNLLHLTSNSGSCPTISFGDVSDLCFYQHDVVRDLALYLGCQESLIHRKRLVMPRKEHSLPRKWELPNDNAFGAQIVSIHTGPMDETQWFEMNFPETEALMLHLTASDYFLPPFLTSMKKLKFLMVFNYGSKRATLKGLDSLSSLTQLKSVRLERMIAPPVLNQTTALPNLEQLSLSLCEGFGNISSFNSTHINLRDFNIDHCSDLEELPSFMFDMPYARTWSITNCHQVEKLPSELGNLSSVVVLRLSALPGLRELPASIGKLASLEYLDISLNECLEGLPQETGQLKRLKKIDMRECSRLRKLPRTVCGLTSLRHVICDEQIGKQWLRVKGSAIPQLRVEIVEERFTLDWLDD